MARHVFSSNLQTVHAWANQETDWGRSSSVSFEGERIYSYRTLMAIMHQKTGYTLLNERKYSVTTSSHQSDIINAIPYNMRSRCIYIDCVGDNSCGLGMSIFNPRFVIKAFTDSKQSIIEKLSVARKREKYQDELIFLRENIQKYIGFLTACKEKSLTGSYEYATELEFTELANLANIENLAELEAGALERKKRQREEERKRLKEREEEFLTALAEWREHKRDDVPYTYDFQHYYKTDFVRLSKDGKYFETHKRAKVPFNVGIQLFRVCANIKNKCVGYETEFKFPMEFRGTPFVLNEVKADGSCVVGCHRFSFSELNNMCKIAQPTLAFND